MKNQVSSKRKIITGILLAALLIGLGVLGLTSLQKTTVITADQNNDGKIDSWSYFSYFGRLKRFEKDRNHDGLVDWRDFYVFDPKQNKEIISQTMADLDFNQTFESTIYYNDQGVIFRFARDTNGDGQIDIVSLFDDPNKPPFKVMIDENFDGVFEKNKLRDEPADNTPAGVPEKNKSQGPVK